MPQPNISAIEAGRVEPKPGTLDRLLQAAKPRPSELLVRERARILDSARRHRLNNVRVFGSCVYGTDTSGSDVDLLVSAAAGVGLFGLARFEVEVEDILGYPVDVVEDSASGRAMHRILAEAVPL